MNNVQELLDKQLSRKEFILHFGAAILAIVGVSGVIKRLMQSVGVNNSTGNGSYGFSSYSGKSVANKK